MPKAITLIELLISITLMSVIVLGAVSFELAGRRFLSSSERKTEVLNEMTLILDHLHKYITQASGDINTGGIIVPVSPGSILQVRVGGVWYEYFAIGNDLRFCNTAPCGASYEVLSSRLMNTAIFTLPQNNTVGVSSLTLRYDPGSAIDNSTNPKVEMFPAVINFTSLATPL